MLDVVLVLIQIGIILLAADFLGGVVHWALDTFGSENTPIWGVLVKPFEAHHRDPTAIGKGLATQVNLRAVFATLVLAVVAWSLDWLSWQSVIFLLALGSINHLHRLLHVPSASVPRLVRWGQRLGILQTAGQHWRHHLAHNTQAYCALTPWLNPLLDRSEFWRRRERFLRSILGPPRHEGLENAE